MTDHAAAVAPQLTPDAPLAFWAYNMVLISKGRMEWPGFSYSDHEWARMRVLAAPISGGAYIKFQFWTAVIFILVAAVAIAALFTMLSWLYPDPSKTPASVFVAILGLASLLTIGFGLPIAMSAASRMSAGGVDLSVLPSDVNDDALARKIRRQIWRMTAIMCGVFVPGTLLWIAYDIQAGPIVTVLKYAAIGLMAVSMWAARRA